MICANALVLIPRHVVGSPAGYGLSCALTTRLCTGWSGPPARWDMTCACTACQRICLDALLHCKRHLQALDEPLQSAVRMSVFFKIEHTVHILLGRSARNTTSPLPLRKPGKHRWQQPAGRLDAQRPVPHMRLCAHDFQQSMQGTAWDGTKRQIQVQH